MTSFWSVKHNLILVFLGLNFTNPAYRLFRKDRNQHGEGLIFYMDEGIPCKTINTFNFPNSLEVLPSEINLRNKKILVIGCYNLPSLNDEYFLDQIHGALSFYSTTYDNFLLLGDLKIFCDDERLKELCNSFSLGHFIKYQLVGQIPTCYMGTNPSSVDHIITNMTSLFMKFCIVDTGISDYHKRIMSICRLTFAKGKSKKFFYRCYKNLNSKLFVELTIKVLITAIKEF